jgi:hypothetical protein
VIQSLKKLFHGLFLVFDVSGPVSILQCVQGLHKIPVKISRASTHIRTDGKIFSMGLREMFSMPKTPGIFIAGVFFSF